jgi:hypothetical protein
MLRKVFGAVIVALLVAVAAAAEVTRTLRIELSGDPAAGFAVENLAGAMTVTAGDVATVLAVATVHAEDTALADAMRFEQVTGKGGVATLRVRYPVDRHSSFRYPGHDSSQTEYDGRRVKVSGHRGVLLWAEVAVTVPRRSVAGTFRNVVGPLEGTELEGSLRFDTGSGEITLTDVRGDVSADTGSGGVTAERLAGSFSCDTGSGACLVRGFDGERLACDTGSGKIRMEGVRARTASADTGSGSIRLLDADVEEFRADTGSGSIELEATGTRLTRVRADTGSGDLRLRLPASASFVAEADQGSGDLVCRFEDARPIVERRTVVGYRRGDGRIAIDVDTGSGDLVIEPVAPAASSEAAPTRPPAEARQ